MSYQFELGRIYRMPTHFGPAPGPRQIPANAVADSTQSPQKTLITASFLTEASALERHIPARFQLACEPVVTIEFHYMTHIDWLAGRGYTMIQLWWPVTFNGECDRVTGRFLAVMWENLADPIITGRGEVGQPKLFAEIPDSWFTDGTYHCVASWMGFQFLEVRVSETPFPSDPPSRQQALEETLMLKYVPRTGEWGEAEVCQVTCTPIATPDLTVEWRKPAAGTIAFRRAGWSDLPTMYHVVNALADLPVLAERGASIARTHGGKSYRDTRILK
ncbi:MAG: acetoacetate decarboxylase family protein [Bradyrhizobiaceae bacterium]|nr:acetoacetate decarboxylase family protein [Bradyrhizobiaceae bacterium]